MSYKYLKKILPLFKVKDSGGNVMLMYGSMEGNLTLGLQDGPQKSSVQLGRNQVEDMITYLSYFKMKCIEDGVWEND